VIYATTNSGYGLGLHQDGKAVFCTEETSLTPISLYGETKSAAEGAIMESGTNISFRLATVFGCSRKMRMDLLVNDFVWRAWNDRFIVLFESHFMRNSVHIRDVARAIQFAIINEDRMRGQIYNLGNTEININKMQLCQAIKKHVPDFYITESPINEDPDKRNYIVSNEKLESLGFKCHFSLDYGIQELLMACPIIKNSNIDRFQTYNESLITGINGSGASYLAEYLVSRGDVQVQGITRWHTDRSNKPYQMFKTKFRCLNVI
jgi:nucleoside-diphosphate-sugar epimerase